MSELMEPIEDKVQTPKAKRVPHAINIHNEIINDPYYWMRDKKDPDLKPLLEAENAYSTYHTKHLEPLRKQLYNEILGRIQEDDEAVPERDGSYLYYTKTVKGKPYEIYCRKTDHDAKEEILLDENLLAKKHDFLDIGDVEISDDHQLLAYSMDTDGSELYTIHIKNLGTQAEFPDIIEHTNGTMIWSKDGKYIYYITVDEAMRPYRLYSHKLGESVANDVLIYEELDASFFLFVDRSKSGRFIFFGAGSHTTSEYYYIDTEDEKGVATLFAPRKEKIEYSLTHQGDYFYILTNEDAENFKLLRTGIGNQNSEMPEVILAEDKNFYLEGCEGFADYLVVYGRKNGNRAIMIQYLNSGEWYELPFPDEVYTFSEGENPMYDQHSLRMEYSSPITPKKVLDFDLKNRVFVLLKEQIILGGYNPDLYHSERQYATSTDGQKIPLSITYKKGLIKDGKAPCMLTAYGAYGYSYEPRFSSTKLSLLDRGFVLVIAHIRGGSEMGRRWYEDGKLLQKMNSYKDLIAAAEFLSSAHYSSPSKIAVEGGSAGGMLVAGFANMRPDLSQLVIANVPFVDVIQSMLDDSLPLTVIEYEEWGNPANQLYYDYMKQYSPYDNVKVQNYPKMVITAGLNDPRVGYWEPLKFTSKLRDLKTDDKPVLCKINMGAGHQGKSGRYGWIEELAWEWSILIDECGH